MRHRSLFSHLFGAAGGAVAGGVVASIAWGAHAATHEQQTARLHRVLVDLLLNVLSAGDPVTERHSRRVAELAGVVFATYPFPRRTRATLRLAALLHDMGKIDDRFFDILHSCQPLSGEERRKIEQHPRESAEILEPLEPFHRGLAATVAAHHECWDGEGYPSGLAGSEIPIGARIIAVADVFDALTQPRAYRDPLSPGEALREIRKGSGSRFDPAIVARVERPEVWARWVEIADRGRREEERCEADVKLAKARASPNDGA